MALKWLWVWVWGVVLMFVSLSTEGCWEEERVALLQLKHFFNNFNSHESVFNHTNSLQIPDCCQWKIVECNDSTGRVISLELSNTRNHDLGEWYLNASLFSAFQQLERLDLSYNLIAGFIENEDLDRLSRLSKLQVLRLGSNLFNNDILFSIVALSSLKELYLDSNRVSGTIDLQGLDSRNNLQILDLSSNEIEKAVLPKGDLSPLRELYLRDNRLKGIVDFSELDSLHHLELLDMSNNKIDKFIFPKGDTSWRELKSLYLENISIHDGSELLQSMGSFPSLMILVLNSNNFSESTNNTLGLHNLTNLEELYLDGSSLHMSLLQSIAAFTSLKSLSMPRCQLHGILGLQDLKPNFKNLKELLMDETIIDITFLQIIRMMTSLEFVSLSDCGLQGTLLHQGVCEFLHLQVLRLSHNDLMGELPSCFANLTSLEELDISSNHFIGNISLSPLKAMISIQHLSLSNNHFQIPISLEPFFNLSLLWIFEGNNNEIYAETGSHSSSTPKFQLNTIKLSCCGDGSILPEFLHHQHDLLEVDFSHNNLTGEFPNWLLDNNMGLDSLVLANNSLSGLFRLPIDSHMHLTTLDISKNFLHGHIPKEIGEYLPSLISLNLSRNTFDGIIPSSIGDMNELWSLDLSFNQLSGKIPEHLAEGCISLNFLVLSNNSLQGQIFSANFNLTELLRLQLDGNHFIGKIPDSLSKASNLAGLYLSDNQFSGRIPSWLGNMSSLEDIIMPNNHFEGPIPLEFCRLNSLEVLNVAENNIYGSLPSCFSPWSIKSIHLSKNRLEGELKDALYNSSFLVTLDLGHNRLHGKIPTWIGKLSHLTYLMLSNNNFEGEVPTFLCQLNELRLLDLSHNNLSGQIPPCLDVTSLHDSNYDLATPIFKKFSMGSSSSFSIPDLPPMRKEETIEFTTKNMSYYYQGIVLTYMSGIDLSCNKITGSIPQQVGNLTRIHSLNLSHNYLTGPIPLTFSKLKQIESLDLSYNNLNGKIPPQLVELNWLSYFNVAHNNLSGKTPQRIAQFITFGENSYEANPLLCGLPLNKSCDPIGPSSPMPIDKGKDGDFIDKDIFYMSFAGSYIVVLIGIAAVLYINPYWRQAWFNLVETWMTFCYYFVVDNLAQRFRC